MFRGSTRKTCMPWFAVAHFGSLINASAFLQTSQSALTGARVVDMTRTRRRKA